MNPLFGIQIWRFATFVITAALGSACSNSNDSIPLQSVNAGNTDLLSDSQNLSGSTTGDNAQFDLLNSEDEPIQLDATENQETEQIENVPNNTNAGFTNPDPQILINTQVSFEITVPAYQSDALQVRLIWNNVDTTANWIGDEYWSRTVDLPSDTEHSLSIIFYDNHGGIPLGSFEQIFRTGSNTAEAYQVSADQFDTARWDTDNDGQSNLEELIAGTDPSIDEDSLLPILDTANFSLGSVGTALELTIADERTYTGTNLTVDLEGNGNYYFYDASDYYNQVTREATRTNTGTSILWEGATRLYDGDYTLLNTFSTEVTAIDSTKRRYVESDHLQHYGTYNDVWEDTSNLVGELVEGTTFCKPTSGSATKTRSSNRSTIPYIHTTTISKAPDDQYWRVSEPSSDGSNHEYFARELNLLSDDVLDVELFQCVFVDF